MLIFVRFPGVVVLAVVLLMGLAGISQAVPEFARQYNVKCETCHFPNPPRLNNFGLTFKRMGFRMPDADDNGNLIFKNPDIHNALDYMSVIANLELERDKNAPSNTESNTSLRLGEVTVFSAHSIGNALSYWLLFLPRNDEGDTELELGELQYNFGKPTDMFHIRGGQMQTLWWQKEFDEGITLSAPLVDDEAAPGPIGSFAGLGIAHKESGVELGYTHTTLKEGKLQSMVLSFQVLNGVDINGDPAITRQGDGFDVLGQGYYLWGKSNTIGAFYYRGNIKYNPPDDDTVVFKDTIDRYGFVGNYLLASRFDAVGGWIGGKDKSTELMQTIDNRGWFLEGDVSISPKWSASYRHDWLNPDTSISDNRVQADTLSTRYHPIDNILLTAEFRKLYNSTDDWSVIGQLKVVY